MAAPWTDMLDLMVDRLDPLIEARQKDTTAKLEMIFEVLSDQQEQLRLLASGYRTNKTQPFRLPLRDMSRSLAARNLRKQSVPSPVGGLGGFSPSALSFPGSSVSVGEIPSVEVQTLANGRTSSARSSAEGDIKMEGGQPMSERKSDKLKWDVVISDAGIPSVVRKDNWEPGNSPFRRMLRRVTKSSKFDLLWLAVITLNAVFLGVQLEYFVQNGYFHWSNTVGETAFTFFFVIELFMRLFGEGHKKYICGPEWPWAMLDIGTVFLSLADVFLSYTKWTPPRSSSSFRLIRMLRILRIAKVIRGIRFMRKLRLLIVGLIHSVLAIAWTVIALGFLMYTGAVVIMSVVADNVLAGQEYYVEAWGGVYRSVCTLFQVMTGDAWWTEVVAGVRGDYPGIEVLFMLYYSVTAYGLLNIVTGIFVDQTLSASQNDVELLRDQTDESRIGVETFLEDIFEIMDVDKNGKVNYPEFEVFMTEPQVQFALGHIDIKAHDVLNLFLLLDKGGDGAIDLKEFVNGCTKVRGQPTTADIIEHGLRTRNLLLEVLQELKSSGAWKGPLPKPSESTNL